MLSQVAMAIGSRGPQVSNLQRRLTELGIITPPTGVFDENTLQSVIAYQTQKFATGGVSEDLYNGIIKESDDLNNYRASLNGGLLEDYPEYVHTLDGVEVFTGPVKPTPIPETNFGSRSGWVPDCIVIQYSGSIGIEHSMALFNMPGLLSSHYLITEEEVLNLVNPESAAWHVGGGIVPHDLTSASIDQRSISITIENFGPLRIVNEKFLHAIFEQPYPADILGPPFKDDKKTGGAEFWMPYTPGQIGSVKALCKHLTEKYPIKYIYGAAEVAKDPRTGVSWSNSPGPAFPLDEVRKQVLGETKPCQ